MKRRMLAFACCFAMFFTLCAQAVEPADGLLIAPAPSGTERTEESPAEKPLPPAEGGSFLITRNYEDNFSDLYAEHWYYDNAVSLYEYGLTEGRGGNLFAAEENVTLAELLTFSARICALYEGEADTAFPAPAEGEAWYEPYFAYLRSMNLLDESLAADCMQIATRAQMLFSQLTNDRYDRLTLGEDLSLYAGAHGEDTLRTALWRSDGTMDQLYLALRLAVSEALTPDAPLVLDDALVRFDEVRLEAAMNILKSMAQNKQILLFTCQARELQYQ